MSRIEIKTQRRSMPGSVRSGFTLVELLVAMAIFITLTGITLTAMNFNVGKERVRAVGRLMQAKFEGARARTFGLSQAARKTRRVGVRFVLDRNDPTLVTSVLYVEEADDTPKGRLRYVDLNPYSDPLRNGGAAQAGIQWVGGYDGDNRNWSQLAALGLIRPGVRIKIDNRFEYVVSAEDFLPEFLLNTAGTPYTPNIASNFTTMKTVTPIVDPGELAPDASDLSFNSGGEVAPYEMTLTGVSAPMPNEDIELFPPETVIDLAYSKIPSAWASIKLWSASTAYNSNDWAVVKTVNGLRFGNAVTTGTSGTATPNFAVSNGTVVTDNTVIWRVFDTLNLEIMFNPNGSVNGPISAEGVLHFLVAERKDTNRNLNLYDSTQLLDAKGEYMIVSLYTNSGVVVVSPADLTDADSTGGVDNLFNFAQKGIVSQ